ncbi:LPXTG cell wall anchor domain-containing protein [uncultured Vagococcus sp.]|uniref:LPXTG cell wall anchor domain-containing protein n=1 Tax=uncultured Vagococcus sp. TaxID=189676 RepID=UPI00258DE195|nr:LPXTG cell wall anchor domain-containing protein [uncultured Vagococcus sp.]
MQKGKVIKTNFFFLILFCSFLLSGSTVGNAIEQEKDIKIGVDFIKGSTSIRPPTDDKDNNYKPSEPQEIKKLLPQTGETILSFMFILIGFSIVLVIVGALTFRRTIEIYTCS